MKNPIDDLLNSIKNANYRDDSYSYIENVFINLFNKNERSTCATLKEIYKKGKSNEKLCYGVLRILGNERFVHVSKTGPEIINDCLKNFPLSIPIQMAVLRCYYKWNNSNNLEFVRAIRPLNMEVLRYQTNVIEKLSKSVN